MRRYAAEAIGTFAIVFTGCGAMLVGGERLGVVGVALAFGLALAAMIFAAGPISGGHFNPAISLAMVIARRLPPAELLPYSAAQCAGGVMGAAAALSMAGSRPGGAPGAAEAIANGWGRLSPGFYALPAAAIAEAALTAIFALVVLATATSARMSPLVAGAGYALVHLVGLPVTRLAANPARALGPALFAGGAALEQLWLFVVAPMVGAAIAAGLHRWLHAPAAAREGRARV